MVRTLLACCVLLAGPCLGQGPESYAPIVALPPVAEEAADLSLEPIMLRIDRLEAENAELRTRLDEVERHAAAEGVAWTSPTDLASAADEEFPVELCTWNRERPVMGRQGGGGNAKYPTLAWSGFLQLDTGWVSQNAANVAAVGDIQAQTGLRRVRLRAAGHVRPEITYVVDLDFAASGHPSFRDVKFIMHDRGVMQNVAVGYFQQPFGLDAMSSGRDLVLMERQLPFAFAPFRQTGVTSYGTARDKMMTWAHSAYAFPTDSFGVSKGDFGGWAWASRGTMLVFDDAEAETLMHVGGSYSFQNPGNDLVRYSIEPGFFVTDPANKSSSGNVPVFVDTGDIATQSVNLFGAELFGLRGPLSLQAEAIKSLVNPVSGSALDFAGASAKLGYVLTGETHHYNRTRGIIGGVAPRDETTSFLDPTSGAWEVTAGWAWIDLNDQAVQGGEMQTAIVGLNRYMNSFTKLQLNVIRVLLDNPADGRSAATVVAMRAQAQF